MRLAKVLYGVAAALTLFGLWVRIAPSPLPTLSPDTAQAPIGAANRRATKAMAVPTEDVWAPIVAGNIFSVTRQPPARVSQAPHAQEQAADLDTRHAPTLVLYGTTVGPQGAVALIRGGPMNSGEILHVGDVVAGARIVDITDSTVTLAKPSGPLILHVPSTERKKL
jgi:hypothetical protein